MPSAVAGLKLWYKSDAGLFQDSGKSVPIEASLDPVGAWIEQSGAGATFDVIQATAGARPIYAVIDQIPWIGFNGSQWLSTAGSVAHGIGSAFTCLFAFYVTAIDTYHALLSLENTGNHVLFANKERMNAYVAADHDFDNRKIGIGSKIVATIYRESGSDKCRVNGVINALTPTDNNNFGSGIITVGSDTNAGGAVSMVGFIGEIIAYNVLLTVQQMQGVERYLANRFPVSLPF